MFTVDFVFRLIGMVILAILGVYWGIELASITGIRQELLVAIGLGIVGAIVGFVITPFVTTRPARYLANVLGNITGQSLVAGLIGLLLGLLVSALLAYPLSLLPNPFGQILPFIAVLLISYIGIMVFVTRQNEIFNMFRVRWPARASEAPEDDPDSESNLLANGTGRNILLDTSVIIDGRISDIAQTGFMVGTLIIPRFVLNELQYIADSPDSLRRQRGRRGMEVLSQLQKNTTVTVRITDFDVDGIREVDEKLVVLARQMKCPILTNDYNLNRVAELQGVTILNVNELANAVKSVLLPGEIVEVDIIQEGRESGQGIAYLDDGTMVVVEDGRHYINTQAKVTVTKVLQTAAGRMIFARKENKS